MAKLCDGYICAICLTKGEDGSDKSRNFKFSQKRETLFIFLLSLWNSTMSPGRKGEDAAKELIMLPNHCLFTG